MKFCCKQIDICEQTIFHTLQCNITHLAIITRETNIELVILKKGKLEKSPDINRKQFST